MATDFRKFTPPVTALGVLAYGYLVMYPEDLADMLAPAERLLAITSALSPWLYGLFGVALASRALTQIWGRGANPTSNQAGT